MKNKKKNKIFKPLIMMIHQKVADKIWENIGRIIEEIEIMIRINKEVAAMIKIESWPLKVVILPEIIIKILEKVII